MRRILERYIVEVVEAFELCPWARSARLGGEMGIEVIGGEPSTADWGQACEHALANPAIRVAMIVAPECTLELPAFRSARDVVAARLPAIGVAEFHPHAALDLATPARLVPFLRRAPDPLLQCVPLALLDSVRASPLPDRAAQAQILHGRAEPPRDVGAQIAIANHRAALAQHAAIEAILDDIARDREVSYARVGLSACR